MLPRLEKVMFADTRVEDRGDEGNRSLGKMLQCCIRYTVRSVSVVNFETPDSFVSLVRVG